ncbi:disintegrin and metalloproteinase domain-containing protein 9-like [Pelobates fuscus]|uniref:disintegrin and metalloproteinase domain-containing protein 9-like n=1 Tax=Pelobates fuscus TaxID=191477 RepID=UPI002FE435BF
MITLDHEQCILHLKQNMKLMSPDFKVFFYSKTKDLVSSNRLVQRDCYFQGYIEDDPHSSVALSTCSGLRGTIYKNGFRYAIEPDESLEYFSHVVYRIDTAQSDVICGLDTSNLQSEDGNIQIFEEAKPPKNSAYVELCMVTTKPQFQFHDENETFLVESVLELINTINTIFQPLNTHMVLAGIEIWSNENLINTDTDNAQDVLDKFLKWKSDFLDSRIKCDIAGLSLRESTVSVSGLAYLEGACSLNKAGFFSVMNLNKLVLSSDLFIHELGHVLGMKHDTPGCTCRSGNTTCTMNEILFSSGFSDCSIEDMDAFYGKNQAQCLWNNPFTAKLVSNNADCTSKEQCTTNLCCDPKTCRLKENATCSSGLCCKNCLFVARGIPCRMASTECDLAEYCDGISSTCPPDTYMQNGSPCHNGQSVCYEKMCYNYNKHCQKIFGESATVASLSCFQSVNTVGDRFGNCGKDSEIIQCDTKDVMCGRLQCENVRNIKTPDKYTAVIQTPIKNSFCWGLDFRSRNNSFDLGAVPDGAQCNKGKICMKQTCVDVSVLGYDCDVEKKCGGNGVCNNKKNCHCNMNWSPPNCTQQGYGGSVDSGPRTRSSFVNFTSPIKHQLPNASNVKWESNVSLAAMIAWLLHMFLMDNVNVFNDL